MGTNTLARITKGPKMTAQHKTLISKTYHKLCTDINIMLEDGWHRDGVTTIIDQGSVRKFCQDMIKNTEDPK